MELALIAPTQQATMSSREIAELVESRHDDVKRSIERLVERGVIVQPPMADEPGFDAVGRARPTKVFLLCKRDSYVVVAQLSPEFTARLVDRWQELETRPLAMPDLSDPKILTALLLEHTGKRIEAERRAVTAERTAEVAEAKVTALAPKAEALAILEGSEGNLNIRLAAKVLGIPERKFIKWLQVHRWAYRQNGIGYLQAYSDKGITGAGYLDHKTNTFYDAKLGENRTQPQLMVTPKGLAKLAEIFAKERSLK